MLSCRLASGTLCLGIYPFLWWFLLVIFVLFLLHWRYELPCQDKLPEFHCTPILGCIRVLWFVFQPLGLGLDKALCGWNSVKNCLQERDTLEQTILGSSDQDFCVLTSLSIHLQYLLEFLNGENSDFLFCDSGETPETVKALVGKAIRDHVTNNEGWRNLQEEGVDSGPVGSHSKWKLASTLARRQGCTQDDVDCPQSLAEYLVYL